MTDKRAKLLTSSQEIDVYFSGSEIKENIIMYHQNIRSINKNFSVFLSYINCLSMKPHIIVLSEAWLNNDSDVRLYSINGYQHYADFHGDNRASGVIVYVHNSITSSQICVKIEGADAVMLDCVYGTCQFKFIGIYRLQEFNNVDFMKQFCKIVKSCKWNDIVCMGDFNIDLSTDDKSSNEYLNRTASVGLEQLVDEYTRVVGESKSILDHLLVGSKTLNVSKVAVIDADITDHRAVACMTNLRCHDKNRGPVERNVIDYEKLCNLLSSEKWTNVRTENDVNVAFSNFYNTVKKNIEKCTNTIKTEVNKEPKMLKPWMTKGLINAFKIREKLYKLKIKNPGDLKARDKYNKYKEKVARWVDEAKDKYYSRYFKANRGDSRMQWKKINEIINGNNNSKEVKIKTEDGFVTDDSKLANLFNNYFLEASHTLAQSTKMYDKELKKKCNEIFKPKKITKNIYLHPVNQEEISRVINSIAEGKSTGDEFLTVRILKYTAAEICPIIEYLFNLSISAGCVPEILKTAIVVPIYKKGDKFDEKNYRPISLLPVLSKMLEKLIKTRLLSFLNSQKFFNPCQYGFRESLSTESALNNFLSEVYKGLNHSDRKVCSALFLDVSKAFDVVDHPILIEKLEKAGIRGLPLKWFQSYLSGRKQKVRIGKTTGNLESVEYGVPQGSVLGPILFLIFVNDLYAEKLIGRITAFADDTVLYYEATTLKDLHSKMQIDLNKIILWFKCNKLVLNVSKTTYMVFSLSKELDLDDPLRYHQINCAQFHLGEEQHSQIVVNCGCEKIAKTTSTKYLGLIIDQNMTWKLHIKEIIGKIRKAIRSFYYLNRVCSKSMLRQIYYALINSKLQYGIAFWGGAHANSFEEVEKLQKRFIRILVGAGRLSNSYPLFKVSGILPLRHLYVHKVLSLFFRKSGNEGPIVNTAMEGKETRSKVLKTITVPKPNTANFQRCYLFIGPKVHNRLPKEIRDWTTIKMFNKKVKCWLLEKTVKEVEDLYKVVQ